MVDSHDSRKSDPKLNRRVRPQLSKTQKRMQNLPQYQHEDLEKNQKTGSFVSAMKLIESAAHFTSEEAPVYLPAPDSNKEASPFESRRC